MGCGEGLAEACRKHDEGGGGESATGMGWRRGSEGCIEGLQAGAEVVGGRGRCVVWRPRRRRLLAALEGAAGQLVGVRVCECWLCSCISG